LQAEQYDLMVTWGHLYMMLNQPAIPARGECVPNVELFRRLAKTMGFDDPYWDMTEDEMLQEFYDWNSPQLKGITLDLLKEHGFMRLNVGDPG
jgi:anaerobic selenocysteine-containing dehydrogenase